MTVVGKLNDDSGNRMYYEFELRTAKQGQRDLGRLEGIFGSLVLMGCLVCLGVALDQSSGEPREVAIARDRAAAVRAAVAQTKTHVEPPTPVYAATQFRYAEVSTLAEANVWTQDPRYGWRILARTPQGTYLLER